MLALRKIAALALAVVTAQWCTSTDARLIPWTTSLRTSLHRAPWPLQLNAAAQLDKQLDDSIRNGRFPKAGRSLADKIREANAFLDRELGNRDTSGVGVSAAIVYKDQVRVCA